MNEYPENLICRETFNAQHLADTYLPRLQHMNKKVVYQIACPLDAVHQGEVVFSRWHAMALPQFLPFPGGEEGETEFEEREGFFTYEPVRDRKHVAWHLNFSDSQLFYAYGGGLFAQDEMQVAEHPVLASLREALSSAQIEAVTVENGEPTPILIRGVERRCAIATNPNKEEGRPQGLYGNHFAAASSAAVRIATIPLNPPTVTNIIAMEAPPGGHNTYTYEEIEYVLTAAFTGFSAAIVESLLEVDDPVVIVHTGFWGCGAYGGNRVLMALLQLLAARLAGIHRFVFYTGDRKGALAFATAQHILQDNLAADSSISVSDMIELIYGMEFQWGVSDGN